MIAIKDMEEIPENCCDCPILCKENGQCEITKKYIYGNDIPTDCPLVDITTTNGNMIQNIFPNLSVEDNGGSIYLHYPDGGWILFNRYWWYAPYEKERK